MLILISYIGGTCALEVVPFMSLRDKLTKHVYGEIYYEFL
ncbi:hypothetical protein SA21200_0217 [Staphylococcus aureus subsp. aureus 21200]|uniref:Uncharacterized protein n=1 Tax=Staphylococcus aureus TaxID=1280 RepID=A0A0U1MIV2_STAAU|nr:hypothetical protein CA347_1154 [Staphylococcus aureus CA-347]AMQ80913.1 30S ribosomal protein S16 [Staphylococcus aureus]ATV03947.1 hypothetical protein SaO11_01121 [Staphylococcus aureus O11]AUG73614.1 hypothetical protein SAO46_01157 [Staphylococcus aureus O46]EGS92262.1 hypothetical protein SA21200_0217 [Staphylococcus aureus subsp. aureus 21200]EHM59788.1 hypothetical protein SA21202_0075 [Staphylococcus aureus subsp. aureus 21202]EHM78566.1 hypothetical protein SA21194_1117 [Staphylo